MTKYDVDAVVNNNEEYLDSREVAHMVGKDHKNLLRDIKGYIDDISQSSTLSSDNFFIESSYKAGTGKQYTCYLVSKKGCEFIANKLQGKKGNQFTAQYVAKFNVMQEREQLTADTLEHIKFEKAKLSYMIAQEFKGNDNYMRMLADTETILTGQKYITDAQHREYTATEIGNILGITPNRVGRDARALGLKAPEPQQNEYGRWAQGKRNGHEFNTWRYFEPAIEKIKQYEIERLEKVTA